MEPLEDLVDRHGGLRALGVRRRAGDAPEHSRWVERVHRSYLRCRSRGWISIYDADELAVKVLGLHPSQIWDDGWWDAIEPAAADVPVTSGVQTPALAATA